MPLRKSEPVLYNKCCFDSSEISVHHHDHHHCCCCYYYYHHHHHHHLVIYLFIYVFVGYDFMI